jgi:hypothetical protein
MKKPVNKDIKKEKPFTSNLDKAKIQAKISEFDAMLKGLMKVKPPQKES